ncbi:leukocyte surface antigen CD53-like [Anthonomus grandis grandis]|uniref:leukocyte surface antigen CD53-like n=1 Tax=Anthonomus grandis grandis TaxID=2921223 RepID=UPI002165AB87|nr:leukocyte surface antigen CD53-like [Anthonomus grandis grandis]
MVSGGMSCVKYLLFCFNLLFAISGLAILVLGIITYVRIYIEYSSFVYPIYGSILIALIVVGVAIFLVSFFGCCGALKENHCMIITFSVLLSIIMVAELTVGVISFIKRNEVGTMLDKQLNSTLYEYYSKGGPGETWDIAQHELNCCGIRGPSDWQKVNPNGTLPHTCCPNANQEDVCKINTDNYTDSCYEKLTQLFVQYALVIGVVGLCIAAFEILGVMFACALAMHIRKEYETV